jgi:hypothetical protein
MAMAAGNSVPVAVTIDLASPHQPILIDETLSHSFLDELVALLIGDRPVIPARSIRVWQGSTASGSLRTGAGTGAGP